MRPVSDAAEGKRERRREGVLAPRSDHKAGIPEPGRPLETVNMMPRRKGEREPKKRREERVGRPSVLD
jgi:hypothetical protein